jgi:hypothetical protein
LSVRLFCGAVLMLSATAAAAQAPGRSAVLTKPVKWASIAGPAQVAAAYPKTGAS